jgi:hypothetical protein
MPLDLEGAEIEEFYWSANARIRWRRPKGADDNELVLEQLYERVTGERQWRPVPTLLDD